MKSIFTTVILIFFSVFLFGQVTSGELIIVHKVATTAEMNAIASPEEGALLFNQLDKNIYIFDGTNWVTTGHNHTPYISTEVSFGFIVNEQKTISVEGVHFLPTSVITVPGFTGTINSIDIKSPTRAELDLSAGAAIGVFDVVIENGGSFNTSWTGNGVGLIVVEEGNDGSSQLTPGESCKALLDDGASTGDGTYWIDPDAGSTANAFQVHCDMTTDGGGWTRIEYAADLVHTNHFGNTADAVRWLSSNFTFNLTDAQINSIRSVSTEGKQTYRGTCDGVIHHLYQTTNYGYSFGFRFHNGNETARGQQTYPNTNITVTADGCYTNNNTSGDTVFDIYDIRLPVINVNSRDNGASSEQFGSPLTSNHAWFR